MEEVEERAIVSGEEPKDWLPRAACQNNNDASSIDKPATEPEYSCADMNSLGIDS